MATRSHTWFDAEKLLQGEELVRSGPARVRIDTSPFWWEGDLVLTSDRLFYLPHGTHASLRRVAFWLYDLIDVGPAGRNRILLRTDGEAALFHLLDSGPFALGGRASDRWLRLITRQMRTARPAHAFDGDRTTRRAAG